MTELHYTLVGMPWWALVVLFGTLIVVLAKSTGSIIDNIGSWLSFYLLIFLLIACFWEG